MMKFDGTLLIVDDIEKTKKIYQDVLNQIVTMDLGEHVVFESGLALQVNYQTLIGKPLKKIQGANNFQLYFEVDDISECEERLKAEKDLIFLHPIKEYPWGQRSMRIYDVDKNIVELAESMDSVIKNFLKQGLSREETAKRTMYPLDYIESLMSKDH